MVHDIMLLMGLIVDVFVGSPLIKLYIENGCIVDAHHLFGEMPQKDCLLWKNITNLYCFCYFLVLGV